VKYTVKISIEVDQWYYRRMAPPVSYGRRPANIEYYEIWHIKDVKLLKSGRTFVYYDVYANTEPKFLPNRRKDAWKVAQNFCSPHIHKMTEDEVAKMMLAK
jgi:hypothetical protein